MTIRIGDVAPINIMRRELLKELAACEGSKIRSQIKLLGMSYHIFIGNHKELNKALESFSKPEVFFFIWLPENHAQLEIYQKDVVRLFHNYLASAKSLVEHTRNIARKLFSGKEFMEEYQRKVDEEFLNSPLAHFVEQLRNYILHKGLDAFTGAKLEFGDDSLKSSITLDVVELRTWDGWTKLAPEYIKTLDDEIDMAILVREYQNKVTAFHKWFDERQFELHQEEYRAADEIKKRLRALLGSQEPEQPETTDEARSPAISKKKRKGKRKQRK